MEADLQSKIYQDYGLHNSLDNQSNNCVLENTKIKQMLQNGAKTPFDIWYEWDINIYKDNNIFPEFADILEVTKDNNLLTLHNDNIKKVRSL